MISVESLKERKPYRPYDLVKSGRVNKRKHEVYALDVNEAEASVVRMIFDKYVNEGYGAQRIATWLNNQGYRARSGKPWHHASIRGILCNPTYTGVLRSGESHSDVLPHLQVITPEQFDASRSIRESRANAAALKTHVPMNTRAAHCWPATSTAATAERGWPSPPTASPIPAPLTRTASSSASGISATAKLAGRRSATGRRATPPTFWTASWTRRCGISSSRCGR